MLKQIAGIVGHEVKYNVLCSRYNLASSWRHGKKCVLVNGSPKTGTTWMLKMVASLPGYRAVGNFGNEKSRFLGIQSGDVVHGHHFYSAELWQYLVAKDVKIVLSVRDPRDQLVSRMFHVRRDVTHSWHPRVQHMENDELLMACIEGGPGLAGVASHLALTQSWLNEADKAICVKYEDMLSNPRRELERVLAFLGITVHGELLEVIIQRNSFQRLTIGRTFWTAGRKPGQQNPASHYRKGIAGDWQSHFKAHHIRRFKELAGEATAALGYELDSVR